MSAKHSIGQTIAEIVPGFDSSKNIVEVTFVPGRPGEDYFVIVDSGGKKFELSGEQFQRLDHVMKGPNSETARKWQSLIKT